MLLFDDEQYYKDNLFSQLIMHTDSCTVTPGMFIKNKNKWQQPFVGPRTAQAAELVILSDFCGLSTFAVLLYAHYLIESISYIVFHVWSHI